MRKVVNTGLVYTAWNEGREARNHKRTLRTDGQTLWSYDLIIGATRSDGQKFALNVGSSVYDDTFVGRTTAAHARGAESVAGRGHTVDPVPMTSPIAMQRTEWTIQLGWANFHPSHFYADADGYVRSAMRKRFPDGITIDFSMPHPDALYYDPLSGFLPPHADDVALAQSLTQQQRETLIAVQAATVGGQPHIFEPHNNLSMLQLSRLGLVDILRTVQFDVSTRACEVIIKPLGNRIARICSVLGDNNS